MATAALCSLVQGTSTVSAKKIVESLMVPLVSLIDDNNIATRSYALKLCMYVGSLKYEQLKSLASALLSRLDDPGSEVREKAAKCLGLLELRKNAEPAENDDDDECMSMWEQLLEQIFFTMMIHLESPEIDLRNALIQSVTDLSKKYPNVYKKSLTATTISTEMKSKLPMAT
jgi:dynein assembly factor 5